jgi:hypothetical protein
MKRLVDVQGQRIVEVDDAREPRSELPAEVLVIGGGLGGVAAALAACDAGRRVCLTEETDWIGGQATSQGVSALDENRYIETTGGTRSYQAFRRAIRDWYRRNAKLRPEAAANEHLDPGQAWVSRLCFEPKVAVKVLEEMLAEHVRSGRLRILRRCKTYGLSGGGDTVTSVDVAHLETGERLRLKGTCVIDATELGDLLALGAGPYRVGADSREQTGEPGALDEPDPEDVQSFTYPFALEHSPGPADRREKPAHYERNREEQPYTLVLHYATRGDLRYGVFERLEGTPGSFWTYRRLIDASQFEDPRYQYDIAMINWPGNDYRGGSILVDSPDEQLRHLKAAGELSLGLLYWLQTEVQRDEGGRGYPELKLRPAVMDTQNGLSKHPYIRESRRMVALKTIVQQEVTTRTVRAEHFDDSVGIGLYAIDLHESKRNRKQVIDPTKPFQIPLGALISKTTANLLAAAKNIGTTHITNGCYRLHPIEWNIGESAGTAAAMSVELGVPLRVIRDKESLLRQLQRRLVQRGVPLMWYDDVAPGDPRFEQVQMAPFVTPEVRNRLMNDLHAP